MNIKDKVVTYLKMGAVLLVAFFVSGVINNEVFINNSPAIRPNVVQHIAGRIGDGASSLAFWNNNGPSKKEIADNTDSAINGSLQSVPFSSVAKGVEAKENQDLKYVVVKDGEVEWTEYTFQLKGKEMKIKVPRGQRPPTQERINELYE